MVAPVGTVPGQWSRRRPPGSRPLTIFPNWVEWLVAHAASSGVVHLRLRVDAVIEVIGHGAGYAGHLAARGRAVILACDHIREGRVSAQIDGYEVGVGAAWKIGRYGEVRPLY